MQIILNIFMYLLFGLITAFAVPAFRNDSYKQTALLVLVWPLFYIGLVYGYIKTTFGGEDKER